MKIEKKWKTQEKLSGSLKRKALSAVRKARMENRYKGYKGYRDIKRKSKKSKSCLHIRLKAAVPWDGRVGC